MFQKVRGGVWSVHKNLSGLIKANEVKAAAKKPARIILMWVLCWPPENYFLYLLTRAAIRSESGLRELMGEADWSFRLRLVMFGYDLITLSLSYLHRGRRCVSRNPGTVTIICYPEHIQIDSWKILWRQLQIVDVFGCHLWLLELHPCIRLCSHLSR